MDIDRIVFVTQNDKGDTVITNGRQIVAILPQLTHTSDFVSKIEQALTIIGRSETGYQLWIQGVQRIGFEDGSWKKHEFRFKDNPGIDMTDDRVKQLALDLVNREEEANGGRRAIWWNEIDFWQIEIAKP